MIQQKTSILTQLYFEITIVIIIHDEQFNKKALQHEKLINDNLQFSYLT